MVCIDTDGVQAYLRGSGDERERARIEAHLDTCDDCRMLVAGAARLAADEERRVARYILGPRIGAGAMGEVYAAEDPELRRRVAIKLLTRPADARLMREAQALARVSHPNVVPIFDVGTHAAGMFLAMELIDGCDLRAWLAARARQQKDIAEIVAVLEAAGRGLAAAHAAGLVHRDFKPDNVLVGKDGRVRVTDFGLAREAAPATRAAESSDLLGADLTHAGSIVGTPAYMAPEQLAGTPAEARSDQFSFCVTAWEALYGERPFAASSMHELRRAILRRRVRATPRTTGVPERLRQVLLRGLAPRPDQRFSSMDALLAALARARVRRRTALLALLPLLVAGAVLVGDSTQRARATSAARASMAGTVAQLSRALALRYDTFAALSTVTSALPVIREVAGNFDRAEFGLGEADTDARRLQLLHEQLASADWSMWTRGGASSIAVADYKGRLVYASGAPSRFGGDLRSLEAVARAYDGRRASAMLIAARDSGLVDADTDPPRPGALFLLAGSAVPGGVPRAVLVQTLDAGRLLDDIDTGPDARLALVAGDVTTGEPPPAGWMVAVQPLPGPAGAAAIGKMVLGRRLDPGVEGIFPHARLAIAGLGLLLTLALGIRGATSRS